MSALTKPCPGIRALFAGLAYAYGKDAEGRDIQDMDEAQREAFAIELELIYKHKGRSCPDIVLDSGNTHQLWLFSFGAYGDTDVYVWADGDVCNALEAAAGVLPPDFFWDMKQAYKEAAEELELSVDTEDQDEQQQICEHAESDLTYTESGYLVSHAWWVTEIEPSEALDRLWDGR